MESNFTTISKAIFALRSAYDEIKYLNGSDQLLEEYEQILTELERDLVVNVTSNDFKLRLPKWVADVFDAFLEDNYDWYDFRMTFVGCGDDKLTRRFLAWTSTENAKELTLAYLNPLTREFVEVEFDSIS